MRSAAARGARRRGESSHTLPLHHGWSSSACATRVVLPAPGGATTTALGFSSSAAMISGSTKSIGSDCIRSAPRDCPVRHSCNALAASPAKRPYRRQALLPLGPSPAFGHVPFSFSLFLCVFVFLFFISED